MANRIYEWKSCRKCNAVLDYRRKPLVELKLGNPLVVCPKCGNVMLSGKKEYIMMNETEKRFLYFEPMFASFFVMLFIAWVVETFYGMLIAIIFFIGTEALYSIYCRFTVKSMIKESIERTKDEEYLEQLKKYNMIK